MLARPRLLHLHGRALFTNSFSTAAVQSVITADVGEQFASGSHRHYCFALLRRLVDRGNFFAAHQVLDRLLHNSLPSSSPSLLKFAASTGLPLDFAFLLHSLVASRRWFHAELIISQYFNTPPSDPIVIDYVILCYCRLGKPFLAKTHLTRRVKMGFCPFDVALTAFLESLCAEARYLGALNLLIFMAKAGTIPPSSVFNNLLAGLCSAGYLDEARHVFVTMLLLGARPTVHSFKSLFYGFCKGKRYLEAERVCNVMELHGFFVDRIMYTSLMFGYCNEGRLEMAHCLFNRMQRSGYSEPDVYAYNTLIYGLSKLGYFDACWKLFNEMPEKGWQPNVATYTIMISSYCKRKKVDCALELLNVMERSGLVPNLQCYTVVITTLYKEKKFNKAEMLFDKMLGLGLLPDHMMFVLLSKSLPDGHEPTFVKKTLQAITKIGGVVDVSNLSTLSNSCVDETLQEHAELLDKILISDTLKVDVIFNTLICALCIEGNLGIASLLLDKMVERGHEPPVSVYNFLIRCLCKEKRMKHAKELVSLMQSRGLTPNLATYSIMLTAHCKNGEIHLAWQVFDEMIEQGYAPTVKIYDSMIGLLCKMKRIKEADLTFKRMVEAGILPDEVVYTTLLNGYARMGWPIRAHLLFDAMIEDGFLPSIYAYCALINGLIQGDMFTKACQYMKKMISDGFVPNTILFTMLIHQFLQKGETGVALDLFDLMRRNQVEPDLVTYGSLISGLFGKVTFQNKHHKLLAKERKKGRHILVKLLSENVVTQRGIKNRPVCRSIKEKVHLTHIIMQDLVDNQLVPDLHIYNALINGLCRANMMQEALEVIELMKESGSAPNHVTYNILISAHLRYHDINSAVKLFNQMNHNECYADKVACDTLIKGFCRAGRGMEALSVIYMSKKRGITPRKCSYNILFQYLPKFY